MKNILTNVLVAIVSTVVTFFLVTNYYPQPVSEDHAVPVAQLIDYSADQTFVNTKPREWALNPGNDFVSVSRRATNSVVNITTLSPTGYKVASGSGVVVTTDGYIVTNQHVVEDGSTFEVTLSDKRKLYARLIGTDPTTDLALLWVNSRDLTPLTYGNSDYVDVGQWVLAVGNPFSLTSTVTAGIVSAKARNINILKDAYSIESFIQTDAVVNPGNSGGALVNSRGELIGINTAIISESGGYEGYSFAIPSNLVRKVIDDIREFGEVKRAVLGVGIGEIDDDLATTLKLPGVNGVRITSVTPGSSAAEAGLRKEDVIVSINGNHTNSIPELQEQVALFRPGDRIYLEYYRNGQRFRKENVLLKGIQQSNNN